MSVLLPEAPVIWTRYPPIFSSTGGFGFGQGGFGQGGFGGSPTQSGTPQPVWVPWTID